MIEGLLAEGPHPELKEKLALFGQFVGDWEIQAQWYLSDGSTRQGKGELHVGWILDGRAVQDVWVSHQGNPPQRTRVGTTIRFFDPKMDAWQSIWISPIQGVIQTFIARQIADEIVLEGTSPEGLPERWVFSEITPRSFRWRAVQSRDGGATWQLTEEMHMQRILPTE